MGAPLWKQTARLLNGKSVGGRIQNSGVRSQN